MRGIIRELIREEGLCVGAREYANSRTRAKLALLPEQAFVLHVHAGKKERKAANRIR